MRTTSASDATSSRSAARPDGGKQRHWTCRVVPRGGTLVRPQDGTPEGGKHLLLVSGSLHAGWAGRLASGLAARHINVAYGTARRAATAWHAEIAIDILQDGRVPSPIEVVGLMHDEAEPAPAGAIALSSFRVTRTARDLEVELHGADAVGFLGAVLQLFASLKLFPREMRIETEGDFVRDTFSLQGSAGQPPPEGIAAALEQKLWELVAG